MPHGLGGALLPNQASHPVSHLLTGFDLPFYPSDQIAEQKRNIAGFDGFTPEDRQAIDRGNALQLFPRLASAGERI